VDADALTGVEEQLTAAGATLTARATLTPEWSSTDLRSFRQALVANLVDYLDPQPATNAAVETSLAEALVQGLTGADPADPDALSTNASTLLSLLNSGDDPLVTYGDGITTPADAVVLVSTGVLVQDTTDATPDADELQATLTAQVALAEVAQRRSEGAVVVDGPAVEGSLVAAIRADEDARDAVTTVSGADTIAGRVSVPLALNARIGGTNGHYGLGDDLTPIPTAVTLPPVDRTVGGDAAAAGDAGTGDAGAGDAATGDEGAQG
jgi:hypothetical protein